MCGGDSNVTAGASGALQAGAAWTVRRLAGGVGEEDWGFNSEAGPTGLADPVGEGEERGVELTPRGPAEAAASWDWHCETPTKPEATVPARPSHPTSRSHTARRSHGPSGRPPGWGEGPFPRSLVPTLQATCGRQGNTLTAWSPDPVNSEAMCPRGFKLLIRRP